MMMMLMCRTMHFSAALPQFLILRIVRITPKLRCARHDVADDGCSAHISNSRRTVRTRRTLQYLHFLIRWRDERMLIPFGCVYTGYTMRHRAFVGCWHLYAISHFNDACSRLHQHKSKCTRQSMSSLRRRSRSPDRMIRTVSKLMRASQQCQPSVSSTFVE